MNHQRLTHLIEHAARGFGEDPSTCPVCSPSNTELEKRIKALEESKSSSDGGYWSKIALGATTSVIAAYLIEKIVRSK